MALRAFIARLALFVGAFRFTVEVLKRCAPGLFTSHETASVHATGTCMTTASLGGGNDRLM